MNYLNEDKNYSLPSCFYLLPTLKTMNYPSTSLSLSLYSLVCHNQSGHICGTTKVFLSISVVSGRLDILTSYFFDHMLFLTTICTLSSM